VQYFFPEKQINLGGYTPLANTNVELRHLRYFVAVGEELNLTRAAERLHTVRPSLSRQISQLEEIFGIRLLCRHGHQLELTDAGRTLVDDAKKLLQDFDFIFDRVRRVAQLEAGRLTIGFFPAAEWRVLPRLLPYLRSQHPDLQILLRILTHNEQITALQNRTINAGFLRHPISDPELSFEAIHRDKIIAVLPARHELARLRRVPLSKLAKLPLVRPNREVSPGLNEVLDALAAQAGVQFRPVMETEHMFGTLAAVAAGHGFSLLPQFSEWEPKMIVCRALALTTTPTIDLLMVYRKNDVNPVLARFLAAVRECFRPLPPT
jgi:LysR family hca operon transcriptional activator